MPKYNWKKLGRVFVPDNNYPWMKTHASNPVAEHIEGDLFRVYFSTRKENNVSSIAYLELDLNEPTKILKISETPVIEPGEPGYFDDSGASMGCMTKVNGKKYLYYLGWTLCKNVPWHNSIGLAIYDEESAKFKKFKAPIMDRHEHDPISLSYPWVIPINDQYRIYYGSNLRWGPEQRDMDHLIKTAHSKDGINWTREGKIAIDFQDDTEYAMSKPCVLYEEGIYKMWFSFRGPAYRMGYAESQDAVNWTRLDKELGITVSDSGWDSETIEYPNVFNHKGKKYMFYNGNKYGLTGFGLAVCQ